MLAGHAAARLLRPLPLLQAARLLVEAAIVPGGPYSSAPRTICSCSAAKATLSPNELRKPGIADTMAWGFKVEVYSSACHCSPQ